MNDLPRRVVSLALIPRDSKTLIEEFCTFIGKFVPHVVGDENITVHVAYDRDEPCTGSACNCFRR